MEKTIKELKKEYLELYDLIYGINACYSVRDMFRINAIEKELDERGVSIKLKPEFDK